MGTKFYKDKTKILLIFQGPKTLKNNNNNYKKKKKKKKPFSPFFLAR